TPGQPTRTALAVVGHCPGLGQEVFAPDPVGVDGRVEYGTVEPLDEESAVDRSQVGAVGGVEVVDPFLPQHRTDDIHVVCGAGGDEVVKGPSAGSDPVFVGLPSPV